VRSDRAPCGDPLARPVQAPAPAAAHAVTVAAGGGGRRMLCATRQCWPRPPARGSARRGRAGMPPHGWAPATRRYVHNFIKYEFDFQFDIPATYPAVAPEIELPELDGERGGGGQGAAAGSAAGGVGSSGARPLLGWVGTGRPGLSFHTQTPRTDGRSAVPLPGMVGLHTGPPPACRGSGGQLKRLRGWHLCLQAKPPKCTVAARFV